MQKAFINGKIIDGTKDMSVMSGKCIHRKCLLEAENY